MRSGKFSGNGRGLTMPGKSRFMLVVSIILSVFMFGVLPLSAEGSDNDPGGGGAGEEGTVHIYHDYYIPWVPGADNCYGAYRVAVSDGEAFRSIFDGEVTRDYKGGWEYKTKKAEPLMYSTDFRKVRRDDMVIITDFPPELKSYREELFGNEIHHHTFHYEAPYVYTGVTVLMNPVHGVPENNHDESLAHIALTRKLAYEYFREDSSYDGFVKMLVPGFGGAFPNGKIIRKVSGGGNHYKYILSLSPVLPETVGWWRVFSIENLNFINKVRANPDAYVRKLTPQEASDLEKMARQAYMNERKSNPGAGTKPFEGGYSWNAPRIFYSPEMFNMFLRQKLSYSSAPKNLYSYNRDFLRPLDMHKLWNTIGDRVAAGLFNNVPPMKTEKKVFDVSPVSGWCVSTGSTPSTGKSFIYEEVVEKPRPVVLKPLFTSGEKTDIFRTLYPGSWGSDGGGNGAVNITTYAPEVLARWPFGYAQYELFRLKRTTRDRLSENEVNEGNLVKTLSSAGGIFPFSSSVGGWRFPTVNIDGSQGKGLPVDSEHFSIYEPPVIKPGMVLSGRDGWEAWARRDRNFYDTMMPYLSSSMGLFFWRDVGLDGLYLDRGVERQYMPELSFSITGTSERVFESTPQGIRESVGLDYLYPAPSAQYAGMVSSMRNELEKTIEASMDRTKPAGTGKENESGTLMYGRFIRKGREHVSSITRSNVKYIPMRRDSAVVSVKKAPDVEGALKSGTIDIPSEDQVLKDCWKYFPIEGSTSRIESWPLRN